MTCWSLTPWRPLGAALDVPETLSPRVIHTISRIADVRDLLDRAPDARFVLEQLTSMRRHGMTRRELLEAAKVVGERRLSGLVGVAMHLPLNTTSHLGEVTRLLNDVVATGLPTRTIFVSHLTATELTTLRTSYPDFTIRPRIGTDLWLGDRGALRVSATVLDVHAIERGETFGYRGRSMPKSGHILVVSGGTAHGIGLEAPTGDHSLRSTGRDHRAQRHGRGRCGAIAVLDRRQAAAVRGAPAHAGLDAVPAVRRARARGR